MKSILEKQPDDFLIAIQEQIRRMAEALKPFVDLLNEAVPRWAAALEEAFPEEWAAAQRAIAEEDRMLERLRVRPLSIGANIWEETVF